MPLSVRLRKNKRGPQDGPQAATLQLEKLLDFYILVQGLDALGARLDGHQLPIPHNLGLLDIGHELALRATHRMADIMPGLGLLTTNLTNGH